MTPTDFRKFLTAGRATFTVTRRRDGARFTYRVTATDDDPARFFVSVLTGPDNESDYTYAGMLDNRPAGLMLRQTRGSKIAATAPSWLGFVWLISRLHRPEVIDRFVEIDHVGRCARCNRPLTVPESIRTGLGPVCAEKVAAGY